MPAPTAALRHDAVMDPKDVVEYITPFDGLLEQGEKIDTVTAITLYPEAAALGFEIVATGARAPTVINDEAIRIWVQVAVDKREDPAYLALVEMPIEFTLQTDDDPYRQFNRTITIPVTQL